MESIEVVAKLAEVAEEWREKRLGKRLPFHAVARESSVGDDAIRKFEGGEQGRNIDRMANAYATALTKAGLETSVFDLWNEAIRRARDADLEQSSSSEPSKQRKAELNAEKHEAELESKLAAESRRSRSSGRHSSKSEPGSESR